MLLAIGGDGKKGNREKIPENMGQMGKEAESAVKTLEELLMLGYRENASDIHMEPWEDRFVIRMRIDGMLTSVEWILRKREFRRTDISGKRSGESVWT